jgi:hypothetical protein
MREANRMKKSYQTADEGTCELIFSAPLVGRVESSASSTTTDMSLQNNQSCGIEVTGVEKSYSSIGSRSGSRNIGAALLMDLRKMVETIKHVLAHCQQLSVMGREWIRMHAGTIHTLSWSWAG